MLNLPEKLACRKGTPAVSGGIDAPVAQLSAGVLSEGEHVAMVELQCAGERCMEDNI